MWDRGFHRNSNLQAAGYLDLVWSKTRMRCGLLDTCSYWGACSSKVLVLICYHTHVRIVTFDFPLKYALFHFVGQYLVRSRWSVPLFFSVSIACGATHAGRILFDTKRKRENSRVWPFDVRVMLLLDISRAWMIPTSTQLWIECGHTTVVSHS